MPDTVFVRCECEAFLPYCVTGGGRSVTALIEVHVADAWRAHREELFVLAERCAAAIDTASEDAVRIDTCSPSGGNVVYLYRRRDPEEADDSDASSDSELMDEVQCSLPSRYRGDRPAALDDPFPDTD